MSKEPQYERVEGDKGATLWLDVNRIEFAVLQEAQILFQMYSGHRVAADAINVLSQEWFQSRFSQIARAVSIPQAS